MDLVRNILLEMESFDHGMYQGEMKFDEYSEEEVGYHVHLMDEAGLLVGADTTSNCSSSPEAIPIHLTWHGHEFIENSKNPTVWTQSKEIINKVGGASIAIWSEVLKQTVLNNLGISS